MSFDPVQALSLVARIRLIERVLTQAWADGRIPGEYYTAIGKEGIYAGVLAHLDGQDAAAADHSITASPHHRITGPMVAHGVDLTAPMVEVMGGQTGLNAGWAGHMHLMDTHRRVAAD